MTASNAFLEHVMEMLTGAGPVTARRMFGGAGLFAGDVMFGLVVGDELYLRADDTTRAAFAGEASEPFTYSAKGKIITVGYWRAPARLFDEPDEMAEWARAAIAGARRAQRPKSRKAKASARRTPAVKR